MAGLGLAVMAAPTIAADIAQVNVIGFSGDSSYFAFEQYGIQDGSGYPYSMISILDVAGNRLVEPPELVVFRDFDEEDFDFDPAPAREIALANAMPTLRRFGLHDAFDGTAILEDYAEDTTDFPVNERKSFEFTLGPDSFRLDCIGHPISEQSEDEWWTPEALELTLTGDTIGTLTLFDHRMFESHAAPQSTDLEPYAAPYGTNAVDFDISGVYAVGEHGVFVVIVGYNQPGFEGFDKRYMAVATNLFNLSSNEGYSDPIPEFAGFANR